MTVAERRITASELCSALGSLPPPQRKGYALHPALAKDWYGPLVALAEEAKREQLGASLQSEKLSDVDLDNALVGELIQKIARETQPSEAEIRNYYKAHQSDFEQVKARHILISDANALASRSNRSAAEAKSQAEELASRLQRGTDFAALAARESDDPYTNKNGGDLGYVSHHQLEPAVDAVLWSLQPGQVSAPTEGRFGYEIVNVEDRSTRPLDAVRESIVGSLKAAALEQRQQEIVASARVSMEPAYTDAPLPCETGSQSFTLKDPLRIP
jgi:parvulin-like peptidyl-prolyl isomerase